MIKRIRCHLSMALTQLGWAIVLFALHTSSPVLLFYLNGIVARVEDGRWYTFDEICTFDCPECIARELLCIVSWDAERAMPFFEARLRSDVAVGLLPTEFHTPSGLTAKNAHLYEFRLLQELPAQPDITKFEELPTIA
jgi:hypothetical protein